MTSTNPCPVVHGWTPIAEHFKVLCDITGHAMGASDRLVLQCSHVFSRDTLDNLAVSAHAAARSAAIDAGEANPENATATQFKCPFCRELHPISTQHKTLAAAPDRVITQSEAEKINYEMEVVETAYNVLRGQLIAANRELERMKIAAEQQELDTQKKIRDLKEANSRAINKLKDETDLKACHMWGEVTDDMAQIKLINDEAIAFAENQCTQRLKDMVPMQAVSACYLQGCRRNCSTLDIEQIQKIFEAGEDNGTGRQFIMSLANVGGVESHNLSAKRAREGLPGVEDVFGIALKMFKRWYAEHGNGVLDMDFDNLMRPKKQLTLVMHEHTTHEQAWNKSAEIFRKWMKDGGPGERGCMQMMDTYMKYKWRVFSWCTAE